MLKVKTYIAASKIHGFGLFASEDIKEGTVMWEFVPGIDSKIPQALYEEQPQIIKDHIYNFCYINRITGEFICPADNDRFTNHSDTPNTINVNFGKDEGKTIAARDIAKDEEITANYNDFEDVDWDLVIRN